MKAARVELTKQGEARAALSKQNYAAADFAVVLRRDLPFSMAN
jgi:hypothetical protein